MPAHKPAPEPDLDAILPLLYPASYANPHDRRADWERGRATPPPSPWPGCAACARSRCGRLCAAATGPGGDADFEHVAAGGADRSRRVHELFDLAGAANGMAQPAASGSPQTLVVGAAVQIEPLFQKFAAISGGYDE